MDVDLRQFAPLPISATIDGSTSEGAKGDMDERHDLKTKKQQHSSALADSLDEESDDCGAPFAKKSKSDQMNL